MSSQCKDLIFTNISILERCRAGEIAIDLDIFCKSLCFTFWPGQHYCTQVSFKPNLQSSLCSIDNSIFCERVLKKKVDKWDLTELCFSICKLRTSVACNKILIQAKKQLRT